MHTPEPWSVDLGMGPHITVRGDGFPLAEMWLSDGKHKANARRIVACVNACEGISTETLELSAKGAPNVKEWFQGWGEQWSLIEQRDALAEALRWYVENDDTNEGLPDNEPYIAGRNRARAALAKLESSV